MTLWKAGFTTIISASVIFIAVLRADAENFPSRSINWIIGFAPGGNSDNGSRVVAKVLTERFGTPVVVENKPGAAGIIAAEYVAAAKPDGYTLLWGSSGALGTHEFLYEKLSFDPVKSFTYIHGFGSSPLMVVVPASSPFKKMDDLIQFSKKNPDKLSYATIGAGTAQHLATALLSQHTGIKAVHIPYKGAALGMTDLLGGRIDFMMDFPSVIRPQLDAGKVRVLAQTSKTRLFMFPDVPTFQELGYPEVQFTAWSILVGPAGMPGDLVEKLANAFNDALKDPNVVKWYRDQGSELMTDLRGDQLMKFVLSEREKFKRLVESTGVSAQ